jgi:hypothetical protein
MYPRLCRRGLTKWLYKIKTKQPIVAAAGSKVLPISAGVSDTAGCSAGFEEGGKQ